jgi:hypothetical protein
MLASTIKIPGMCSHKAQECAYETTDLNIMIRKVGSRPTFGIISCTNSLTQDSLQIMKRQVQNFTSTKQA